MKKYSLLLLLILFGSTGCQQKEVVEADRGNSSAVAPDKGYQNVFDKDYEQHQISSRMRANFKHAKEPLGSERFHNFSSAGLNIYLPENMKPADRFTGFVGKNSDKGTATMVIVTNPFSMQATTEPIVSGAIHDGRSGILFSERVNVAGREGAFYFTQEKFENVTIGKYVVTFGNDDFSWIVKCAFSNEQETEYGAELLKALLNIEITEERAPVGEDIVFTMNSDSLVLTDGFVDKLVFTLTGKFPENTVKEPVFQATRSVVEMEHKDENKQALARLLIPPTPDFEVNVVSSEKEIELDGMGGYEFVSIGRDRLSDEPLMIYSAVVFDRQDSYLMHGWASSDNEKSYIGDFRALAHSLKRKNKPASSAETKESAATEVEPTN